MKFVQASSVVAALPVAAAAAAASGTFDILSMNVAGLPPIFNGNDVPGDKATNARQIGTYFSEYNYGVINVQEVGFWFSAPSTNTVCLGQVLIDYMVIGLQLSRLYL